MESKSDLNSNEYSIQKQNELLSKLEKMIEVGRIDLMTVKEVMKELKISRNSFNRLKDDGIIPIYSLRGKLYSRRSEILQIIENCRVN